MNTISYWIDSAKIKSFPKVNKDLEVDILVVGAGLTGVTAAYLLKKAGKTVALIDRARIATIDTGHTTAHLTYVTDKQFHELVKNLGEDHAQALWDAGAAAIDQIEAIVVEEEIECEFTRVPGYLHEPVLGDAKGDQSSLREDVESAQNAGFEASFLDSIPHFNRAGIRFADQAKFHPRKYLAKIVDLISGDGSHIFEQSAASEFDVEKKRAKVGDHWINFGRTIIATHNPLLGMSSVKDASLFQTKLALFTSYVVGAQIPRGTIPIALFWDTQDPYHYLRADRHDDFDYVIFGGEDHKTGQAANTEDCFARLADDLKKILPEARIDHRWSGQVIETNDGLPFIGPNADDQFIATGFSGNGMTFGTISAMMARDWTIGARNPWSELFDVDRKKIKGGAWDYMRENADYPYYMIKDRLTRAEADSVRDLAPNCGMIVKSKKGKIAAYRDSKGKVHKVSAVCTHLGCIVRWNTAEKTWDCPCHGSRFKPTGEVIAGPAETPLPPA